MTFKIWVMSLETLAIVCLLYYLLWVFGHPWLFWMFPVAVKPNPEKTFGFLEDLIRRKYVQSQR